MLFHGCMTQITSLNFITGQRQSGLGSTNPLYRMPQCSNHKKYLEKAQILWGSLVHLNTFLSEELKQNNHKSMCISKHTYLPIDFINGYMNKYGCFCQSF